MPLPVEIFVVSHECEIYPGVAPFKLIQVGHPGRAQIPGAIRDSTGENISELNDFYAELTAQYWVWKNRELADRVGFFHYRRYLDFTNSLSASQPLDRDDFTAFDAETMARFRWSESEILLACGDADIVLPRRVPLFDEDPGPHQRLDIDTPARITLYENYARSYYIENLNEALAILRSLFPQYADAASRVIQRESVHHWNIFIMKRDVFAEYMEWLFAIFFELQRRIDLDSPLFSLATGQRRVFGFLGENLLNIFVDYQHEVMGKTIREFPRARGDIG